MATSERGKLLLLASALLGATCSLMAQQPVQSPVVADLPAPVVEKQEPKAPADLPPTAPRVSCQHGEISIHAENATLGSILGAVQVCLGIRFELPAGESGERVFTDLGPGPARKVISALLSDTDFNYAIGTADDDPDKIQTVVLMARGKDSTADIVATGDIPADRPATAARQAWAQNLRNIEKARAVGQAAAEGSDTPAEPPAEDDQPTAEAATAVTPTTDQQPADLAAATPPPAAPAAQKSSSDGSSPSSNVGSRIADMQQMFEQRKQMVQSQRLAGQQPN